MTKKLLMIADDFVSGGAFMVGVRLADGLAPHFQVAFACDFSGVNQDARRELRERGGEVLRLFAHAGDLRRARHDVGGACALLRRTKPEKIVFVDSSPRSNLAAKDVARETGVPYVSIINFVDAVTPPALKIFDADVKRTADAAAAVVFVSAAARQEFEVNYPGVAGRRLVISNGVPDRFFAPIAPLARQALRGELGIGDDEVALLLAGRLEPRKGQMHALAALAALVHREGPRLRLLLAGFGDADARQALAERIRKLGLDPYVRYLGVRNDLPLLLEACDIALLPSEQEADGLASKEAMARARPVVASDLPALREQGHSAALLVPAPRQAPERTVQGLTAVIDALRRDPARRAEIGRDLRVQAESRFTMAQMVASYLEVLGSLPARRPVTFAPALELGRWLDAPKQAAGLFKDGWADFERKGLWSLGAGARIAFALHPPASDLSVSLKVRTLATADRERSFEVFANGRRVATWTFASSKRVVQTIRLSLPAPRRLVVLRLRHAKPSSSFQLGLNGDRRQLGLFVFQLRIDAGAPTPRWPARLWRSWRQ